MLLDMEIGVNGTTLVGRRLTGLVRRFGNLGELMERFGTVLESSTIERFETQTTPRGRRWKPSFRARHEGGATLTDTARLKQSIRAIASPRAVEIGSNVVYARIHQEGGTIVAKGKALAFALPGLGLRLVRSVTIPRRQFLGLSTDDRVELEAQVLDYIDEVAPGVEP